jgi:hypothetical protein
MKMEPEAAWLTGERVMERMKRLDGLLLALMILLGACCLLLAATGFDGTPWLPQSVRDLVTTWAPILGVLVAAGLLVLLLIGGGYSWRE